MKVEVLNIAGQPTGREVELSEEVFGIEPNDHVLYLAVKQYLAKQRQGTHKAKERGEITGSTRKIKRQKGTGTARAGSIKNPLFKGGGRIFGPRPREYNQKINKKVKALARKSALSYKAKENKILVIEDINFDTPKTKAYLKMLQDLSSSEQKSLLVLSEPNKNVYLSSRNIPKATVLTVEGLNTYKIMNAQTLIISESAAKNF
ncbi:MAG: 50S ribosomal protein L4 [Chitinophagales bacterium]